MVNQRPLRVPVRKAKDRFSELVRRAAAGEEIVITRHGEAEARLCPVSKQSGVLEVDREWLRTMEVAESQTPAEILIRADRDRGD